MAYATLADHVAALEAAMGGEFQRAPQPDGSVIVRIVSTNGDVIAAAGADTGAAIAALDTRVTAFLASLSLGTV